MGVWGSRAASQTALFALDPAVHSRLNTLCFTLRFLGVAPGPMAGTLAWTGSGWTAVPLTGVITAVAGLIVAVLPESWRFPGGRRFPDRRQRQW
ncbi:hypothetical protein [Streptomyces sp. NPDC002785]|uniref:hypothetical protein n=1 Tax=Streptomyces sp. NPDC002785 TaxID=3154543 RepID=UPI00331EC3FE